MSKTDAASAKGERGQRQTLVAKLAEALRAEIAAGHVAPGARLPSESALTKAHGVSRTVVREAIAALRSEGLVEARQGAGVFVLAPEAPVAMPFRNLDPQRVSSTIELLELRNAIESEAAALAAQRLVPQWEEALLEANAGFREAVAQGLPTGEADYRLHLAIARATGNPRFPEFLEFIGTGIIPRAALGAGEPKDEPSSRDYLAQISAEHDRIVQAILDRDEEAARTAMRTHLKGSYLRYRAILR
ncbi:FadR/GntR family transcriptional regulator [Thioclava sp. GXIMD4216]|uniref:FadR/GntR family transcriptional regulator n=1 Tax=Thioclava sp. GXIMD4216 TaxID=3131929 RepID=UPI0030D3BC1D